MTVKLQSLTTKIKIVYKDLRIDTFNIGPSISFLFIIRMTSFAVFLLFMQRPYAQIRIDQSNNLELSPENLVQNVFIGQGVKVESVDFQGTNNAIGVFRNATNDIGIDRGIVISTGTVDSLSNSNNDQATGSSTSVRTVMDDALAEVAGSDLFDVAVLEIKFKPVDNKIGFNFVFGSEEYPEFVCSQFNDVFAFFIDGPNPAGGLYDAKNIALVPDPADATGNTVTDFPVTINSVNNGVIGSRSTGDCRGPGESLDFSTYFNDNALSRTFTLDGFLDVFRAQVEVIPCELYTLRLAIGDGFDDAYDSAVFLEAKSFTSTIHTISVNTPGVDYTLMEGCDAATIEVSRVDNLETDLKVNFEIATGPNSAIRGEDFSLSKNELVIPAGSKNAELKITALEDGQIENDEKIYFVFQNGDCFKDTIELTILDYKKPVFAIPNDTMLCEGEKIQLEHNGDLSQLHIFEKSGEFPIGDPDRGDCRSTIIVSDLEIKYLNQESFFQVCIDQLEHQWLSEMEIYLVAPAGQIIELSTNNGEDGGNGDSFDQLINTCFTVNASQIIHNGNREEGPFLSANPTYTGNFLPEQEVTALFNELYSPVNGNWSIIIKDNVLNSRIGTLFQWSLKFSPKYSEQRKYIINNEEVIGSPIVITENAELEEIMTHNYGCTFTDKSIIDFTPLPEAPIVMCSNPLRNQILLEWGTSDVDEYELKIGNADWKAIGDDAGYLIDNLGLSSEYSFEIRSVKNGCLGPSLEYICQTPECANSKIQVNELIPATSGCLDDGVALVSLNSNDGPFTFRLEADSNEDGLFQNLSTGAYRVFGTDRYGCAYSKIIEIEGVPPISLDVMHRKVSCDENVKGTAWVQVEGGRGPYEYLWNNGSKSDKIEKLNEGIYSVTVIDTDGCAETMDVNIEKSTIPTLDYQKQDVPCYGEPTGSVELMADGGEGPYQYRWDDGYASVLPHRSNLLAGTYLVSVLDYNICSATVDVQIEGPEEFVAVIDKTDNACFGASEGIARLNISGGTEPYEVFWSTGDNSSALGNLRSGDYGVTITDASGCRTENDVEILEPEEINLEFEETPISCFNGEDGILTVKINGGSGSYWYEWNNDKSFPTINNLISGRYCVSVTDENGCVIEDCHVMEEPPSMDINIETQDITCYQSTDGSLQIDVLGGSPPYQIELNGESIAANMNGRVDQLRAGSYFVKIIDNIGCSTTKVIEILEAPEPSIFPEIEHIQCYGENSGSIFLRYLNEPNAAMIWSDDRGNTYEGRILSNLHSGQYDYEITTRLGCVLSGSVSVDEPVNKLQVDVQYADITCHGDRNGEIILSGIGGSGNYFYSLQGVGYQRSRLYQGLKEGTYNTYIQDDNGCVSTGDTITIIEPEELKVTINQSDTIIKLGSDIPIEITLENVQGEIALTWEVDPDQELSCETCKQLYVNNVSDDFLLRVTVLDENLCKAQDEVKVFVIKDYTMYVPTGFSPNADANNEILNVFGPDYAFVKEFNVFLRNGTNIYNEYDFRPNDYRIGWDGEFHNKKMPAGIYIWTMHVEFDDGVKESFKGSVQLIR